MRNPNAILHEIPIFILRNHRFYFTKSLFSVQMIITWVHHKKSKKQKTADAEHTVSY